MKMWSLPSSSETSARACGQATAAAVTAAAVSTRCWNFMDSVQVGRAGSYGLDRFAALTTGPTGGLDGTTGTATISLFESPDVLPSNSTMLLLGLLRA